MKRGVLYSTGIKSHFMSPVSIKSHKMLNIILMKQIRAGFTGPLKRLGFSPLFNL